MGVYGNFVEFGSSSSLYPCLKIPSIEAGWCFTRGGWMPPSCEYCEEVIRGCGEDVFRQATRLRLYCGSLKCGWEIPCQFGYHFIITWLSVNNDLLLTWLSSSWSQHVGVWLQGDYNGRDQWCVLDVRSKVRQMVDDSMETCFLQVRDKKNRNVGLKTKRFFCETLGEFRTSLLFLFLRTFALKMLVGKSFFPVNCQPIAGQLDSHESWVVPSVVFFWSDFQSTMTYGGS